MKFLILGGTLFAGRAIVEAALADGHQVTLFNRGKTNPGLFPDVNQISGDRDGDVGALSGMKFDVVVDTSAYFPRQVDGVTETLGNIGVYVFVSSASVYADQSVPGMAEEAEVETLEDDSVEELGEKYGAFKALCEEAVSRAVGDRALIVRSGLIVGPHDNSGRFTYWVERIAEGGQVLAPMPKDHPIQFVDVRDLADWIVGAASRGVGGTFNVASPNGAMDMQTMLEGIVAATNSDAELVWVDEEFLTDRDVEPWSDLPLWLAPQSLPTHRGFMSRDTGRAMAVGLTTRPLSDTVSATLQWLEGEASSGAAKDFGNPSGDAGLSRDRERALLEEWSTAR
ncbi:MAG: NAD-dependent epimerase/dehydratase family protein [Acidimicrobiia bacterium]